MKIAIRFLIIILLAQGLKINAQNNTLSFWQDRWLHFEGVDLGGATGLTLEGWVNLSHYVNMVGTEYSGSFVLVKEAEEATAPYHYGFILAVLSANNPVDPGTLAFGLNFGTTGNIHEGLHSINQVPLNEWVHVAGTWDGQDMKVYINGELDNTLDVSSRGLFFDPVMDTLHIGSRKRANYPNDALYGYVDEARIWNVCRTQSEIRETMYTELSGNETGLFAYYKLNEGSGQTITDSGPNGFNGTLGDDTGTSNDPAWASSTAPLPYYTVADGYWSSDATWAPAQNAPLYDWARVEIRNSIVLDANETVEDITISSVGDLTVNTSKTLTINGDFTIESDNTGTGSFIDNGSLSYTSATVQRYLTQNDWHFIGMPVSSATAGVFYLPAGSDIFLRTHIESSNTWDNWITSTSQSLALGRGYECWVDDNVDQDETIAFSGTLNTGNYTTGSGAFYGLQYTSDRGLNLIANPYPSALMANISSWTKSNVANAVWVWDGTAGNYLFWNGSDGTNGSGWGTLAGGVIPAMQAFFVETTGTSPTLTIPHSDRVHSSQDYYKSGNNSSSIRLNVMGNLYNDALFVAFNSLASDSFDPEFDVKKIHGLDEAPQFYSKAFGHELSINTLPEYENSTSIKVGFDCSQAGEYVINVSDITGFSEGTTIYLEDLLLNSLTTLSEGLNYTFEHNPSNSAIRFKLHFTGPNGVEDNSKTDIKVWSAGNRVYAVSNGSKINKLEVLDLSGKIIDAKEFNQQQSVTSSISASNGLYIIKLTTDNSVVLQKVILRK
ncbi:MAG: T9SS type A sorting domain-containing protein [Bacteroidales bacterium]|nr:T9SS type A sorting domain-containing protein [Bacteroidales bacterium]MCF8403963.1 T9SS type A sorting domain-containing protein [Bacteroidales bacterium]